MLLSATEFAVICDNRDRRQVQEGRLVLRRVGLSHSKTGLWPYRWQSRLSPVRKVEGDWQVGAIEQRLLEGITETETSLLQSVMLKAKRSKTFQLLSLDSALPLTPHLFCQPLPSLHLHTPAGSTASTAPPGAKPPSHPT